jgi:hypothetical protein
MDHSEHRKVARCQRHAVRLRETAEAALPGSPLKARLLELALQYDRMAAELPHNRGT